MQKMMTPAQVAEFLQINTATVYRLIRERKLAATQIGRAYRVPHEDLEAFLGAHSSRPEVRAAILRDFMKIADARPGLDSDAVLEELEREDAAARVQPQPV